MWCPKYLLLYSLSFKLNSNHQIPWFFQSSPRDLSPHDILTNLGFKRLTRSKTTVMLVSSQDTSTIASRWYFCVKKFSSDLWLLKSFYLTACWLARPGWLQPSLGGSNSGDSRQFFLLGSFLLIILPVQLPCGWWENTPRHHSQSVCGLTLGTNTAPSIGHSQTAYLGTDCLANTDMWAGISYNKLIPAARPTLTGEMCPQVSPPLSLVNLTITSLDTVCWLVSWKTPRWIGIGVILQE